jgi:membrane fusion protein (multidrug efflux system)
MFGLGVVALLVTGYFVAQYLMFVTTDNAQVDGHFVLMAAKVPGYVTEVHVREGQKVKKDEVLVEIDARDYDNTLRQVSSELTSVAARKDDSEKTYRRINDLFKRNVVTQAQFDAASSGFADVKAKWDAVSAQVAQAKLNLDNTKLRAPSDGFIARKSVEIGQLASPGAPLLGFVDAHERWITANFKETDLDRIKVGAAAKITVDAIDGRAFTGKVESISSATGATFTLLPPDNATGNFTKVVQRIPVRILLDQLKEDEVEALRVGLSAFVKISTH